ncbi:MAG: glycosyltransferase [Hydrogenophilales bacterium]|nr:glycosyltransferase [Hydrogenophilales bacterium]
MSSLELTGPVPRVQMLKHYSSADVFLLPSKCEGSAGVVYEAIAAGLPVVCTPNTGSVVCDGVAGFIVPIRDAKAIGEALSNFIHQRELLVLMGHHERLKAQSFGLAQYKTRLISMLAKPLEA